MDYIPFEEYRRIWDSVNIAAYNQKRQEALGNIYSLLMMKKTVYLRPGTTTAAWMEEIGVVTPAFTAGCGIRELPADVREENARRLREAIDPEKSRETWRRILGQA